MAIASSGRAALVELERMLEVLRSVDEAAPTAPAPGIAGLPALAARLRAAGLHVERRDPPLRVIMLTTFERDEYVFEARRAGASGYLLKSTPPEHLAPAIRTVAAGDALLAPSITRRLVEEFAGRPTPERDGPRGLDELTGRERQVLMLIARGHSNAEIV